MNDEWRGIGWLAEVLEVGAEELFKALAAVVEAAHHGADGDVEDLGDFGVGALFDVEEDDGFAGLSGDCGEGAADDLGAGFGVEGFSGDRGGGGGGPGGIGGELGFGGGGVGVGLGVEGGERVGGGFAEAVEGEVAGDGGEPGGEGAAALEGVERLARPQDRVHEDVLRVGRVREPRSGEVGADGFPARLAEVRERLEVARLRFREEFGFRLTRVCGGHAHGTNGQGGIFTFSFPLPLLRLFEYQPNSLKTQHFCAHLQGYSIYPVVLRLHK